MLDTLLVCKIWILGQFCIAKIVHPTHPNKHSKPPTLGEEGLRKMEEQGEGFPVSRLRHFWNIKRVGRLIEEHEVFVLFMNRIVMLAAHQLFKSNFSGKKMASSRKHQKTPS